MRFYVSHTYKCVGWDIDAIFNGTSFKKSCRTQREIKALEDGEKNLCMLDWNFRKPNWEKHLELAEKYTWEVIMAPDLLIDSILEDILEKVDILKGFVDRVVIPVHQWNTELKNYELAYPNMASFSPKNRFTKQDIAPYVTHILGGSPHKQLELARFWFPNLISVDGNMIAMMAIFRGKYWVSPGKWIMDTRIRLKKKKYHQWALKKSIKNIETNWKLLDQHQKQQTSLRQFINS